MSAAKNVVLNARVSKQAQDRDEDVSIEEQLAAMRELCQRNGWNIIGEFVDNQNYIATKNPKRGKVVNPSGERDDRPALVAMLELAKTGTVDAIVTWRDDRLVRHPRVNVAIEDALDIGDSKRNGKPKIQIYDATGATLDRFTMAIKAAVWKEENKRRVERVRLGQVGTLKAGGWPNRFNCLGYEMVKEAGKRGRKIVLASEPEVQLVKTIYNWADVGHSHDQIRRKLIAQGAEQKGGTTARKRPWGLSVIRNILHTKAYMGKLTYTFADGDSFTIEIPQIIEPEQWYRVQKRMKENQLLAERNTKGIYLLQGIASCGECGGKIVVRKVNYSYKKLGNGERRRYNLSKPKHQYFCRTADHYKTDPHPRPYVWRGESLEWTIWRYLVDNAIKNPEAILEQVQIRQAALQAQGNDLEGTIAKARRQLMELEQEHLTYARQLARGRLIEAAYDVLIEENEQARIEAQAEIERLTELRDDAAKVQAGMDYAREFLNGLQEKLSQIDFTAEELNALPAEEKYQVLKAQQKVIRSLCDKIIVYANGKIEIEGMVDGGHSVLDPFRASGERVFVFLSFFRSTPYAGKSST